MPKLKLPTPLRPYAGNQSTFTLEGETVAEILDEIVIMHPQLEKHLFDDNRSLRPFVNCFLGEDNVSQLEGLKTPLSEDDTVLIIPSIAGG